MENISFSVGTVELMRAILQLVVALALLASGSSSAFGQVGIRWLGDLRLAQQLAQRDGRLLLIHFYTDWCVPCHRLDQEVFPRDDVTRAIASNYIPVKLNAEREREAATFFQVDRCPTDIIADANGRVLLRTVTPQDPGKFIQMLQSIAAQHRPTPPVYQGQSEARPVLANRPTVERGNGIAAWNGNFNGRPPRDRQTNWGPQGRAQPPLGDGNGIAAKPNSGPAESYQAAHGQSSPSDTQYPGNAPPYDLQHTAPGTPPSQYAEAAPQAPSMSPTNNGAFQVASYAATNQKFTMTVQDSMPPAVARVNHYAQPDDTVRQASSSTGSPCPQVTTGQSSLAAAERATAELPLALDGYCPVTLAEREKWCFGDSRWGIMHRGRVYRFASREAMEKFRADPDRYSPVLSGFDVVRYVDTGQVAVGNHHHGMWFHGKMYLFADEAALERFSRSAAYYEQRAYEIMVNGRR